MTESETLRTVPLLCPSCAGPLCGLASDVVFGCLSCAAAFEVKPRGALEGCPLQAAVVEGADDRNSVPMPFWCFPLTPPTTIPNLVSVYVSAFELRRRQYYGDPGFDLTAVQPCLALVQPRTLQRAVLSRDEAVVMARFEVLHLLEMRGQKGPDRSRISLGAPSLLIIPLLRDGDFLANPWIETRYSIHAFPDLAPLEG